MSREGTRSLFDEPDEPVDLPADRDAPLAERMRPRTLDEYATAKGPEQVQIFREIRDQWIVKVGWLVGRHLPQQMVE